MDDRKLAGQKPRDIDEAVKCMRSTLVHFHEQGDKRAIFLRMYYIMTLEVHAAIHRLGAYEKQTIFLDPDWIARLSGRFATAYFRSLEPEEERQDPAALAWEIAHTTARQRWSPVVQNAVLGINAHINYDLPQAIAANLDPGDLKDYPTLQRRKFDHDQVNNLLVRTLGPVQDVLARDYAPGIGIADHLLGGFDERLSRLGLKHYRERVWWDALTFAAAATDEREQLVRDKLRWESVNVAKYVNGKRWLWGAERALELPSTERRTRRWRRILLEKPGGVVVPRGRTVNPLR